MLNITKKQTTSRRSAAGLGSALLLTICLGPLAAGAARAADSESGGSAASSSGKPAKAFSAGLDVREQANLKDIGLPAYPGARPQRDKKDDKEAVTLGFSFGPFGMKLIVSKFASDDSLDRIADFYRDALAVHGPVLDCSSGSPAALAARTRKSRGEKSEAAGSKDEELDCGDVGKDRDERVYKVGTEKNFRLVSLKQVGHEVHFQMVRMEARGF